MTNKNYELELYFDLDETVYSLSEIVIDNFNKDHGKSFNYKENDSYWWQSTGCKKEYFEKLLFKKGIFFDGNPIEGMVELINKFKLEDYKIYFLTMPQHTGDCYVEKCSWLKKHFKWINIDKHLIATGNKKLLAKSNRILIDDNAKFLIPWSKEGGISIGFGGHSWTLGFKGHQANSAEELYNLIKTIEKGV